MKQLAVIVVFYSLILSPAYADGHALAMHGVPKYDAAFRHLDYTNPHAPKGGTLKQAVIGSFDTLHDQIIKGTPAAGLELVYDKLMARVWDEPFTLYGLIAERIEIPEDRSAITYHLNPEAVFHDGHPVTADDVIFTYEMLRKYGHPVRRRVYGLVEKVVKLNADTVRFEFGEGYDAETALILSIMPVLPKHAWEGKDFSETSLAPPLGSGPYKVKEVQPGRQIIYERVKNYWAKDLPINVGHHNFDTITFDYYRDQGVAIEAFLSGAFDIRREWDPSKWVTAYPDTPGIKKEDIKHGRPEWVRGLVFNTRRSPFDDIRVRQALNQAFDFDWLNKNLFYGMYKRLDSTFANSELAARGIPEGEELRILRQYADTLPKDVFGPAWSPPTADQRTRLRTANTLLEQAGWVVKDGRRVHAKSGKPFVFEVMLNNPRDERLVLQLGRALKKLGIEMRIRTLDSAQFTQRLDQFDYDVVLYWWINSLSPGNEQLNYWGSDAAKLNGSRNYAGVQSPAIDALADSIARASDRNSLVARTRALDRALMWGHYMIPLYYLGKDLVAYQDTLKRPEQTPVYGIVLETWWSGR